MTSDPQATLAQASTLIDLHRAEDALPLLSAAIASDPDDYRARCLLALALVQLGRHAEAAERAREAVAVGPEEEWAYRLLAIALVGQKKPKAAVEAAERAVALAPELPEAHITLAGVFTALDRGREAGVAANRAVELDPGSSDAHAVAGEAALSRKDLVKAEAAFRRSLELDPEDPAVLNNLGVVLLRTGRRDEAMQLFESAARGDPRSGLSRRNLTGVARRFVAMGGLSVVAAAFVAIQLVRLLRESGVGGDLPAIVIVAVLLGCVALMQVHRRLRERELSRAARELLRDERRRVLRRPWTWEAEGRWLPLPLWLVFAPPPLVIAVLGALVLLLMLANAGGYRSGDWAVFAGVALFTAFFVLRARDMPRD